MSKHHLLRDGPSPETAGALVFAAAAAMEVAIYLLLAGPPWDSLPAATVVYLGWSALFAFLAWTGRSPKFTTVLFLAALWSGLTAAGFREGPIAFQGAGVVVSFLWLGLFAWPHIVLYASVPTFVILLLSSVADMGVLVAAMAALAFTGAGVVSGYVAATIMHALKRERERLKSAQQLARIGSWEWDLRANEAHWSEGLYLMFGINPNHWAPSLESFLGLVHEDDRERVREAIERTIADGTEYDMTYRVRCRDGHSVVVRALGQMEYDRAGRPVRVHGTAQDITEAHEAQELAKEAEVERAAREEAEKSRRRVEEVLESVTDAYYLLGSDWRIVDVNSQATRILGKDRGDLLGQSVWGLFPESESLLRPRYEEAISSGVPQEFSFNFPEWTRWLEVRAFPNPIGLSVFFRDITEAKELEEALAQSQKMQAIGLLSGGIAHDFNNLLTVVLTNATLLEPTVTDADPDAQAFLSDIQRATQEGTQLIRRLLAFSRKTKVEPVPTRMDEVVADLERSLLRLIPSSIEVQCHVAPGLPHALVDRTSLTQVILNLAINARDAMPDGGKLQCIVSAIELADSDAGRPHGLDPGPYIQIRFVDTGTGMSDEIRDRIFEPFFTTKPPDRGTGLGLAVVYGIIRQHGGGIEVETAPEQGTTFRILLPVVNAMVEVSASDVEPAEPEEATRLDVPTHLTILVADDSSRVRTATERVLSRAGHQVLLAADGQKAWDTFQEKKEEIDLVVTDLSMPQLTGAELVQRIQELDASTRVLIVTGWGSLGRIDRKPDAGVPLIRKPWFVKDFLEAVERAAHP